MQAYSFLVTPCSDHKEILKENMILNRVMMWYFSTTLFLSSIMTLAVGSIGSSVYMGDSGRYTVVTRLLPLKQVIRYTLYTDEKPRWRNVAILSAQTCATLISHRKRPASPINNASGVSQREMTLQNDHYTITAALYNCTIFTKCLQQPSTKFLAWCHETKTCLAKSVNNLKTSTSSSNDKRNGKSTRITLTSLATERLN